MATPFISGGRQHVGRERDDCHNAETAHQAREFARHDFLLGARAGYVQEFDAVQSVSEVMQRPGSGHLMEQLSAKGCSNRGLVARERQFRVDLHQNYFPIISYSTHRQRRRGDQNETEVYRYSCVKESRKAIPLGERLTIEK